MKATLAFLVFVAVLANQASGVPPIQTSASTNSFLVSSFSELTASRTISENYLISPIVNYNSNGQVDSYVVQPSGGGAIISQNVYSTAYYSDGLGGMTSFSSKITATNSKGSSNIMTGTSNSEVCYSQDYALIQSETFGMGVAKPGEGEYDFVVNGGQETTSNILPAAVPVVVMSGNENLDKELIVTFKQNSLEMEVPADFLQQEVSFNYGTYNNEPTFYGYDFSNGLVVDDTISNCFMSFSHIN